MRWRFSPNQAEVSPLGVATSLEAHAECVLCPGFRELFGVTKDVWSGTDGATPDLADLLGEA